MSGKRSYDVANHKFGFNGWKSEIIKSRVETAEESLDGKFTAFVETTVRVTIRDGTYCEVTGCGKSYDGRAKHVALGKAKKHALTDAKKRALQKFGILDQMFSMNNESYQPVELKTDASSEPLFTIKPSKKKIKSSLFKRSGKLDLQKTTFNARKDVVFIKHKPISELTLPDPTVKLAQQIATFAPTKHLLLLKPQESLPSNKQSVHTLKHDSKVSLPITNESKPLLQNKVESKSVSANKMAPVSTDRIESTKKATSVAKIEPKASSSMNKIDPKPVLQSRIEPKPVNGIGSKEQSIKNHQIKAEDPIHQNLPSDKKDVQIPTIPALSLQDSFSYDGDEEFFAELLRKEEEEEHSMMDGIDDEILGSLSTQALVGNR